jgi:ATP-dependent DNA ligase
VDALNRRAARADALAPRRRIDMGLKAVCDHGLEGIVAKKRNGIYRPGYRGWTKLKNPGYWRRESEIGLVQRRHRRVRGAKPGLGPVAA